MVAALLVAALALPGLVVSYGGKVVVSGTVVARGTQPAWSPDGSRIAFVRDGTVRVIAADGTGDRRLARGFAPAWSPDGGTIAFSNGRDVLTVGLADRRVTNLTHSPKPWLGNTAPAYSPDGKLIAFARSTDAFNSDIFLMTPRGRIVKRLTHSRGTDATLGEEHGPAWSPDGRSLVYVSNRARGSWELYTVRADGTGERRLTRTPRSNEDAPRFSRDGTRILYAHDGRIASIPAGGGVPTEHGPGNSADWR